MGRWPSGFHVGRNSFRQWTGYVFSRAEIPSGFVTAAANHWNQDAKAIINEVVRREYDKLR